MNFNALNLITSDSIVVNRTLRDNEAWLGATLFPARKKVGITLDWIKTYKGRSVELMPSNLDAIPVIRQRGKFTVNQNRMAFYRESMQIKEEDMIMHRSKAKTPRLCSRYLIAFMTMVTNLSTVRKPQQRQCVCSFFTHRRLQLQAIT